MRIIFLLSILISTVTFGQSQTDLKKIDDDYNKFLKNVFQPAFKRKATPKKRIPDNFVFSNLKNKGLLKITNKNSFAVTAGKKDNKFLAAIMYGVKHFATYEFVADDYAQLNQSKDLVMKELLRIKVHIIPDTASMTISKSKKLNEFETINQYKHKNFIRLEKPVIITYYSSHHESENGMNKNLKILIKHNQKTIYSSSQNGNRTKLNHNASMNKYAFVYKTDSNHKLITGGLMHHTLNNFLFKIKSDVHMKAVNISNVSDYYDKNNKDLKRLSNKGKLIVSQDSAEDLIEV